jgi:hypothetical protein
MRRGLTVLAVVATMSGVLTAPAGAGDGSLAVIAVDNVEDLYASASLTNVVISLAPGTYVLDSARPNGGRVVLGQGTELVSTLELQLDAHGVPTGAEIEAGAVIDIGNLRPSFVDVGAVVLGKGGRISGLTVTGNSFFPSFVIAIDMPFGGSVHHVIAENSFQGVRIMASAQDIRGSISESLIRHNFLAGVTVVQANQLDQEIVNNATIRANIDRNRIEGFDNEYGFAGVFVLGGINGSNNRTQLFTSQNVIGNYPVGIRLSQTDNAGNALGTDNNTTRLTSRDDTLSGNSFAGLEVLGAFRENLSGSSSDGNRATAHMIRTKFSFNGVDVVATGSLSFFDDDQAGENNLAKVILSETDPAPGLLTMFVNDCFLPVDSCQNEARVVSE